MKGELKKIAQRRKMADRAVTMYGKTFALFIRSDNSYRWDSHKAGGQRLSLSHAEFITIEMIIVKMEKFMAQNILPAAFGQG